MPKVYIGPYAQCTCCNKPSPLRFCSVAGPVAVKTIQIDHKLITQVFQDVSSRIFSYVKTRNVRDACNPLGMTKTYTYWRFHCLACGRNSMELYWVEASPNNWIGGWCKYCLHRRFKDGTFGHPEDGNQHDMHILQLNATKKVAGTLAVWNEAWQQMRDAKTETPEPQPEFPGEEQLF